MQAGLYHHQESENRMKRSGLLLLLPVFLMSITILACAGTSTPALELQAQPTAVITSIDRLVKIPETAVKISAEMDEHPPHVYSTDYSEPVPLPGLVNTAGAEDSPFILPDGNSLYFFFTPSVKVPAEQQVLDGVTGIYLARKLKGTWGEVQRVMLQEPGKLALDGCEMVLGELMWFCSTREGYTGIHWFTARWVDGLWQDWTLADFDPAYQVGELHISADGSQLFYGSGRPGGAGGLDIWVSQLAEGTWQEPMNISAVNTSDDEGWPATNFAGDELWFYRNYGIWRSTLSAGEWQVPELVVSPLAGEPTLDAEDNLYFVHHFFSGDTMLEADIYMSEKK
jgi:WD40-like Beta Propeller Repeat